MDVDAAENDEELVPLDGLLGELVTILKIDMLPLKSVFHLLFVRVLALIVRIAIK